MAHEPLLRLLQDDNEALDSALRRGEAGSCTVSASTKETLLHMEGALHELKFLAARLPVEQRASVVPRCEAYERQVATHRASLQAAAEEQSRGQLLQGPGGSSGPRRRQQPTSREDGERQEVSKLTEARDQLKREYGRMQGLTTNMDSFSSTLSRTQDQYHQYQSKLDYASQRLGQLKRKTEGDSRFIWWSFYFFLSVVAHILMKRLKIYTMLYMGASWTVWSGTTAAGILQAALTRLVGMYESFCDLLGIPSMLETKVV